MLGGAGAALALFCSATACAIAARDALTPVLGGVDRRTLERTVSRALPPIAPVFGGEGTVARSRSARISEAEERDGGRAGSCTLGVPEPRLETASISRWRFTATSFEPPLWLGLATLGAGCVGADRDGSSPRAGVALCRIRSTIAARPLGALAAGGVEREGAADSRDWDEAFGAGVLAEAL